MQFLMSHLHALGSPKNHSSAVFGRARSRFGAESKVSVLCQNTERSSEFDMTRTDACGPLRLCVSTLRPAIHPSQVPKCAGLRF